MMLHTYPDASSRAWAELNMNHLLHNADVLKGKVQKGCRLMPAVKANAYGHGMIPVAKELTRSGIRDFCVATLSEAIVLRESGIDGTILILGFTSPQYADLLFHYQLTQTVVDLAFAKSLNKMAKHPVAVHIAIDTGMHRLGIPSGQFSEIFEVFKLKQLSVTGVFSHLCVADRTDEESVSFSKRQANELYSVYSYLLRHGYSVSYHILNSAGMIQFPHFGGDYARPGIALYGLGSDRNDIIAKETGLKAILSLKATVVHIADIPADEGIGYGLESVVPKNRKIAVLSIGYADGVPRALSCGRGFVLIRGRKAHVVGRICMDQMLVDVTDIRGAKPGDTATLIGCDGNNCITAYDIAEWSGTITNDILSGLGERLYRVIV